ncbi:hypothetical protein B0H13DRAFT_2055046 [Mycena leptocephala]|nr:hypothetical protein B0H13DRAFT_2055046 [Mycena leptocephala]
MSVKELQARIVLKQLVKDKSAVQRQLNAVQDPVARLPLEISSKIFLECLPLLPVPGARFAPMLLLNVCNSWTSIALSTGALWATFAIEFSARPSLPDPTRLRILKLCLHRARNYPLSIRLINSLKSGIHEYRPTDNRRYGGRGRGRLEPGFSLAHTIRFLGLVQNLVELTLDSVITESDYKTTQKLVLPSLVCLNNSFAFAELDEWLRLVPSLTHLEFLLTIHNAFPSFSDSSWQTLLCALSARRSRLLHFKFTRCEPPADVCAGLRQLVVDGMDIHIGSDYENLISI